MMIGSNTLLKLVTPATATLSPADCDCACALTGPSHIYNINHKVTIWTRRIILPLQPY
ncbi:hypothetical protein KC19_7G169600 [Ceratodon purpureus]|uniref:Uncharacterized protein n=1 Tax=Ceratodon purpureus TaxID=3225 RepID=A0A8T0HB42_CERPU|nr:hypothetical protein KC19_7G169600 [Ceratodon purpureus]